MNENCQKELQAKEEERRLLNRKYADDLDMLRLCYDDERQLSFYDRSYRFIRNTGLELVSGVLEGLCAPFSIGGLTINFDGIRNMKTSNGYMAAKKHLEETYFDGSRQNFLD